MFRVLDAVKFGAGSVCPICNSDFVSPVASTRANGAALMQEQYMFIEGGR